MTHLVDEFYSRLEHVDYVETFKSLKLKYDQVDVLSDALRLVSLHLERGRPCGKKAAALVVTIGSPAVLGPTSLLIGASLRSLSSSRLT